MKSLLMLGVVLGSLGLGDVFATEPRLDVDLALDSDLTGQGAELDRLLEEAMGPEPRAIFRLPIALQYTVTEFSGEERAALGISSHIKMYAEDFRSAIDVDVRFGDRGGFVLNFEGGQKIAGAKDGVLEGNLYWNRLAFDVEFIRLKADDADQLGYKKDRLDMGIRSELVGTLTLGDMKGSRLMALAAAAVVFARNEEFTEGSDSYLGIRNRLELDALADLRTVQLQLIGRIKNTEPVWMQSSFSGEEETELAGRIGFRFRTLRTPESVDPETTGEQIYFQFSRLRTKSDSKYSDGTRYRDEEEQGYVIGTLLYF